MINIFTCIVIILLLIIMILIEIKLRSLEKDINRVGAMTIFLATQYIKQNKKKLAKKYPEEMKEAMKLMEENDL